MHSPGGRVETNLSNNPQHGQGEGEEGMGMNRGSRECVGIGSHGKKHGVEDMAECTVPTGRLGGAKSVLLSC